MRFNTKMELEDRMMWLESLDLFIHETSNKKIIAMWEEIMPCSEFAAYYVIARHKKEWIECWDFFEKYLAYNETD